MRLENLYQNFSDISEEAQSQYIAEYRLRRAEDMSKIPTWPKPKKITKSKSTAIKLTPEEEIIKKLLKLTKKQVLNMRTLKEN